MKIENEIKYKIKNTKEIIKIIKSLGFKTKKDMAQKDYYFSPPHKNFKGTKKYYLRLRKDKNKTIFAYHVVISNLKTKEFEVEIDDSAVFLKILELLGFKLDCIVDKKRKIYYKDDIFIMIDVVKNLGVFIEIEYQGVFNKKIKKEFSFLVEKLKLDNKNKIINSGYPDLLFNK